MSTLNAAVFLLQLLRADQELFSLLAAADEGWHSWRQATIGRRDQETHGWPSNQCLSGTIAEEWTQSSCGPAGEKQVREWPKETMEQAGRPEGQPAGASGIAGLASKDKGR